MADSKQSSSTPARGQQKSWGDIGSYVSQVQNTPVQQPAPSSQSSNTSGGSQGTAPTSKK